MVNRLPLLKEFFNRHRSVITLAFIGFAIYANAFYNQMFWDDNDSILNNLYVHDWGYFLQYFSGMASMGRVASRISFCKHRISYSECNSYIPDSSYALSKIPRCNTYRTRIFGTSAANRIGNLYCRNGRPAFCIFHSIGNFLLPKVQSL